MAAKREYLTIGQVVKELRPTFPDLSISKVRFLEEEGLIRPERTAGGYRKFRRTDVARLELALRMQEEKFLPLRVIRESLDALDRGEVAAEARDLVAEKAAGNGGRDEREMMPAEDVVADIGLPPEQVKLLEEYGLIEPEKTADGKFYSGLDAQVIAIARDMGRYGIEPRHLRMYGSLAEREAGMFQQILLPVAHMKGEDAHKRSVETFNQLAQLSETLKRVLLRRATRGFLEG